MVKRGIVLSDLHIGTGHRKGQINIYDDFREDERLGQLLARYSAGEAAQDEVTLILNGDIFDLLKVPVNGKFPDAITERLAVLKLEQCLRGHPLVARALTRFLANGKNQIIYQPGNHDMELHYPAVQRLFCRAVTGEDTHPRLKVISGEPSFSLPDGVHFHHGHQFEAIHAMDFKRLFLTRGHREPILNLPWGSLFILNVVNQLVRERPYLDKVMPFWPLFAGGMLLDTRFTVKMVAVCGAAFAKARLNPMWWEKRPFEKVSRFLSDQIGFFEQLDRHAGKMLAAPDAHAVFMGHTHCEMVRIWPRDKAYVNTGSWLPMVNLRISNLGQQLRLHYGTILWRDDGPPRIALMRWHGTRPEEEEVIS